MICSSCGEPCKDEDKFCNNCGHKIISSSDNLKSGETEKAKVFSNSITKYTSSSKNTDFEPKNGNYKSSYRDSESKRKVPIVPILVVILLVFGLFLFIQKDKLFYSNKGKRTIMIYMVGSDLESKYLSASKDIDEIINANVDFKDVNILIYTGGSKEWHKSGIPNNKHALFEINSEGLVKIEEYDQNNMLESENLTFLLEYGYNNYDTEYYDLILWDHGAGPIYGYGYDEYNKLDSMSLEEIKKALYDSPFNGANKLELIGFDACLMSSIEIASSLSDYADYMVASQEFEPANGWDYSFLSEVNKKTTSLEFGKLIVNYFMKYYDAKDNITGVSLSLLKLNKVENVINYLNDLFTVVDDDLTLDFSLISRSRSSSKSFGRLSNDINYYDLVDLIDLVDKLPDKYYEKVNNLKVSINDLVVYQETDLDDTNGVSIYFPYENKREIVDNMKSYQTLDFAPAYYSFISDFSSRLTGNKESDWNIVKSEIKSVGNGDVSVVLPTEVALNLSSADYIIFEKDSDGWFIPIFNGTDVNIDGNVISTNISRKILVASDSEGNRLNLTAIESQKGKNFVKYNIPGTLTKWDLESYLFDIIPIYLELVVDEEHPDGYIQNIFPMDINENYTYSKFEIDLKEWNSLSLVSNKYNILDATGKYKTDWDYSNEVVQLELSTKDEINIKFEDLDISNEYYCIFRVKDSQGNSYYSNIVLVNTK